MVAVCGALDPHCDDVKHVGLAVGDAVECDLGKAGDMDRFAGVPAGTWVSGLVLCWATARLIE